MNKNADKIIITYNVTVTLISEHYFNYTKTYKYK